MGKELSIHKTPAGWYIGVWDEDGPRCRISTYYRTKEAAEKALKNKTFFPDDSCVTCPGICECVPEEDDYENQTNEDLLETLIGCNRDPYMDDVWHCVIDEIARRLGVKKLNF
jgi:hypothetical protein